MRPLSPLRFLVFLLVTCATALALAQSPPGGAQAGQPKASFDDVPAAAAPAPAASAPSSAAPATATTPAGSAAAGQPAAPGAPAPGASPAGASPAPAAAASGAAPAPTIDGATYAVRLRDLEARVDQLKEQIRRSHTRLSLLSDTILAGGVGGSRVEITLANELSGAFKIVRALVVLDGAVQYNRRDDEDAMDGQEEVPVFSGSIPPGDHTVQVLIEIRGHGYGMFSYLRGWEFEQKSSHAFTVTEGKTVQLRVIAFEKGGVTTPLEQRPSVRYVEKVRKPSESRATGASLGAAVGSGAR